ncbi:hypothetical protein [Cellvibrio sp.]
MDKVRHRTSEAELDDSAETLSPFSDLLNTPIARKALHNAGILIGTLIQISKGGIQIRSLDGEAFTAIAACPLSIDDTNKQCAFMLSDALNLTAVVIGLLQKPVTTMKTPAITTSTPQETEIHYPDGLRITCGDSSLTLNPDGKVEIRGTRIINQASELHRIKAGSVRIN